MPDEEKKLDELLKAVPRPKITIEIETGIFWPFVWFFSKFGLCKMKEKCQAENPGYNVRYDFEAAYPYKSDKNF